MPKLSAAETKVIGEKVKTFELTWELQGRMLFTGGTAALCKAAREGKKTCAFTVTTAQDRFRNTEEARAWGADKAWDPWTGKPVEL
ncbi:hypothetical protein AB0G32_14905 [Streptomyces sp. NPDC023723]|uniref:hypothetical protein n=1 Tax=Streptomyces sp. NPDC023723 TaxID=3154323 RepID=UPI0033E05806